MVNNVTDLKNRLLSLYKRFGTLQNHYVSVDIEVKTLRHLYEEIHILQMKAEAYDKLREK
jgi:hypothetical protein